MNTKYHMSQYKKTSPDRTIAQKHDKKCSNLSDALRTNLIRRKNVKDVQNNITSQNISHVPTSSILTNPTLDSL